jgi:hypothetical protein
MGMDEQSERDDAVREELRQLGANLRAALREARESDEWRRLQTDIAAGLEDAASALRGAAEEFAASPTGQKLQDEMSALHQRVRTGDVAGTIRSDILSALRTLNADLEKGAWRRSPPAGPGTETKGRP